MGTLEGRTALITGGAVGLGLAIADAYADAGARVGVTYLTHEPGGRHLAIKLDATDEAAVDAATAQVAKELGQIDILVNNAGGLVQRAPIADMPFDLWRKVMAVNLDSMYLVTHYALRFIPERQGRIINMASLAGRNGGHPGATAYAATKAGVFGFTRGLAKELAPRGITVNAIAPGFIEGTPFHDTFTTAASKAQTITTIPLGRAGVPADVATAALWLAGPDTGFISGAIIDVNGAQYFG